MARKEALMRNTKRRPRLIHKVLDHAWHRNGISGTGFYVLVADVRVDWDEPVHELLDRVIITLIPGEEEQTRVVSPDNLSEMWRGPNFYREAMEYIDAEVNR